MWLCVIGKNADFVKFLSNYVLYFAKKNVDIWEFGDIIGRYKRNSLVKSEDNEGKISEFENMSIYSMSI